MAQLIEILTLFIFQVLIEAADLETGVVRQLLSIDMNLRIEDARIMVDVTEIVMAVGFHQLLSTLIATSPVKIRALHPLPLIH